MGIWLVVKGIDTGVFHMKRKIEQEFKDWVSEEGRNPLLVRGVRQVGKTFSVRSLGKSFKYFAEVNFEEKPDARVFFKEALSARPICEKLSVFLGVPVIPGETLLFFDEVQSCPEVLASLRYFHEQMPGLHVVVAGSLLEFALQKIPSLGVGRLTSRFMYPLTFPEFLDAIGDGALVSVMNEADYSKPVELPFHKKLVDCLRTYMLVGGMPAAVNTYNNFHDFHRVMNVLDDLILTFQDDFGKYRRRIPVERLNETFRSVAAQIGGKFVCSSVDRDVKSTAVLNALDLLVKAGLVHLVFQSKATGLPLGANMDGRKFKAILFDPGIHQRLAGLDMAGHMTADDLSLVNKGSMAELLTGLHLAAYQSAHRRPELYYWHREERGADAEVDYVIQRGNGIVPVEVKAGVRGGMQSMRLFLKERGIPRGLRVSLENFGRLSDTDILPLYAAHRIYEQNLHGIRV